MGRSKNGWLVRLAESVLNRPKKVLLASGLLVTLGLASWFWLLPREGFPPTSTPLVLVETIAGGLGAQEVDSEVMTPLNQVAVEKLEGVEEIETTSFDNGAFAVLVLGSQTDPAEIASQYQQLAQEQGLADNISVTANTLDAAKFNGRYNLVLVAFNDKLSVNELDRDATHLATKLAKITGLKTVEVLDQVATTETGSKAEISFSRFGNQPGPDGVDTRHAVLIGLIAEDGVDNIELSDLVNTKLAELNQDSETKLAVGADPAPIVRQQIQSLFNNMAGGLLAVAVVTLLLIAFRASLLSALFIACVVIVTMAVLWLIGYSINTMSLFAVVLALGLFVDDATIVTEAAERVVRRGKTTRVDLQAVRKIAMASMAGTLTTVLVFLPLAFLQGILGDFIRIMPVTISIALIISLLFSLFVLPISFKYVFKVGGRRWVVTRWLSGAIDRLADLLARQYDLITKRSKRGLLTAGVAIVFSLFVVMAGLGKFAVLPFNIFPETKDGNDIQLNITYPLGTTIEQAKSVATEIDSITAEVLGSEQISLIYYDGTSRSAQVAVALTPYHTRDVSSVDLAQRLGERLNKEITGVDIRVLAQSVGPPAEDYPFKGQIYSEDPVPAVQLAGEIIEFLKGKTVIRATGTEALITDARLGNPSAVQRTDGRRYVEFEASFDASDVSALTIAAQQLVEENFAAEKVSSYGLAENSLEFNFGFESENQESFASLLIALPVALLAMYILLSLQFKSLLQPLLVFLAIPFSLFGVAYGLSAADYGVSFFTMFGFLGLIGIAVNNTILLVDYANQEIRQGRSAVEAIANATRLRLRPLIVTTLTTVAALTPLAISDPFWQPLAITIMFGLLSSTALVIIAFPYYYLAAYWLKSRTMRLFKRRKNEATT